LNPNQPPPASDPSSRAFIPGPFTAERLEDHYYDTLKSDIMTMTYTHLVPGEERARKADRLRSWDDSSPYHKNRPLRGPRGGSTLRLLNKPRTFRNVPGLEKITVHTMVKGALQDKAYLAVAGMVVQAITGVRAEVRNSKQQLATWSLRKDIPIAMKAELKGPQAYRFLSSLVDVVMPRIKDYQGAKGSSGDSSGNISFGFSPEAVALFPEVEVNYDM
jgi:large subunit ribosomal protein L5